MLLHSLRSIPSRAIVAAVRDIVATTRDVELKQVAEAWLAAAPEVLHEDDAAATGDAPAATAEPDGWQPVAASRRAHGSQRGKRIAYTPQHKGRLPAWLKTA